MRFWRRDITGKRKETGVLYFGESHRRGEAWVPHGHGTKKSVCSPPSTGGFRYFRNMRAAILLAAHTARNTNETHRIQASIVLMERLSTTENSATGLCMEKGACSWTMAISGRGSSGR